MRIHHLNCGTTRPFGGRLVSGTGSPFGLARQVCHCLLIETPDGLVLIDTGLGLGDVARPERLSRRFRLLARPVLEAEETAARQIVRLGYTTSDVRHIVVTHLDVDHAGGLAEFPHAKVHVHATELQAATRRATSLDRFRYHPVQWAHGPDWVEHRGEGESWFGFSAVRDLPGLPPSILLLPLAGHTRGHSGIAIDTGGDSGRRWLLHCGDAYFNHAQMAAEPSCPPATRAFQSLVQTDRTARIDNLNRLAELAKAGEVDVFCAHDRADFDRLRATRDATPTITDARVPDAGVSGPDAA